MTILDYRKVLEKVGEMKNFFCQQICAVRYQRVRVLRVILRVNRHQARVNGPQSNALPREWVADFLVPVAVAGRADWSEWALGLAEVPDGAALAGGAMVTGRALAQLHARHPIGVVQGLAIGRGGGGVELDVVQSGREVEVCRIEFMLCLNL